MKPRREEVKRLRGRAGMARRARWLWDHPLCAHCEAEGNVTPATVPDHIVALINGGADDESNLQSLCDEHHRIKTAKDLGFRVKPEIGPDGWAIKP